MGKSGQHVALHDPDPPPDCVGYIHTKMSPVEVARNASEDARSICLREYGSAPDINIYGDPKFTFPSVFYLFTFYIFNTKGCIAFFHHLCFVLMGCAVPELLDVCSWISTLYLLFQNLFLWQLRSHSLASDGF